MTLIKWILFFALFCFVSNRRVTAEENPELQNKNIDNNINNNNNNNNNINDNINTNDPNNKTHVEKSSPQNGTCKSCQPPSVPHVMSLFQYDKTAVQILRDFLADPENVSNLTSQQEAAIKRYVDEWDELLYESNPEVELFSEMELASPVLPTEIEKMFKLVRMVNRVAVELLQIIDYKKNDLIHLAVKIVNAEIKSGDYFDRESVSSACVGMLNLVDMYFTHPSDMYPEDVIKKIPTKDFVSVAFSSEFENLRGLLKWIEVAKKLALEKQQKSHQNNNETHQNNNESHQNNNESHQNNNESHLKNGDDGLELKLRFASTYLDIVQNVYSYQHDIFLQIEAETSTYTVFNLFPKPLIQASVTEQSRILFDEKHKRKPSSYADIYEQLCNGYDLKEAKEKASLACRYDHQNAPWLFLMPSKVEVLHENPQVLFFHHVITDGQIKKMQQFSLPIQEVAQVVSAKDFSGVTQHKSRISHLTFINEALHKDLESTVKIASYLTGLETATTKDAEELQVNVYRPGGQYKPHHDAFPVPSQQAYPTLSENELQALFAEQNPHGNRIATLMFYLNDVESGGRTVFPRHGVSAAPEKGGALFWYSLLRDGRGDVSSEHAGCPVVAGVKWVANKWFLSDSQMFNRPCLLSPSEAFVEDNF